MTRNSSYNMTIAELVDQAAERFQNKVAMVDGDRSFSFTEVKHLS